MKKDPRNEQPRPFRLAHQTLCITAFNFETESLLGYVEMLLHPLRNDLRKIKLNSKQCRIYRVAVNDIWEAPFSYNDPTLEICQGDGKQRNVEFFESCQLQAMLATDADYGNGEVLVRLPSEAYSLVTEMKPFRLILEFSLERPKGGIKFVVPDMDGTMLDRGAHLFTHGHESSSRLWFPCVDSYSEVCTWKLELTVDMYMTAVSCGDLIETVYTADLRKKTYRYFLGTPTAAPNIGLAVGPFEVFVDQHMHEVTHFCLPHMLPLLKHTVAQLHETFEFYEEVLSSRYPFSCYKQVFVDQMFTEHRAYATVALFSMNLLHTRRVIEQTRVSRRVMALALAEQYFGSYMGMASWFDAWLPKGMSRYLAGIYCRKAFGNNEYRYRISKELEEVAAYEASQGGILLDPSSEVATGLYFSPRSAHTVSTAYADAYALKSHLVVRMLELRTGRELLLQVFNKLLTLASAAAQNKVTSNTWSNMLLSASGFLKAMATVTGKDSHPFLEQWVYSCGVPRLHATFVFNRKRNVVELDIKSDCSGKGAMRYIGPLTVAIQELDGTFKYTFKIEETNSNKLEITCHSKARRHKKKKIPLCTGEEVDMDLNDMEPDSPVLWLRIDPDLELLRIVTLEQPDYMWQYMLRHERCVIAQAQAIQALSRFPTPMTRLALTDTLENEHCFYRVRIQAAQCLSKVSNSMEGQWAGPPAMMSIFRSMFGAHQCPAIVRRNNFANLQRYMLQKAVPQSMAELRNALQICPPEVMAFLLDLLKYNDNSRNKYKDNYYRAALLDALAGTVTPAVTTVTLSWTNQYTDNYYRAALLDALAGTVTPAVTTVTLSGTLPSTDLLTPDTRLLLEELTRALNMEKLMPSHRHVLTVSCLRAIRRLQRFGHLPCDPAIFKTYAGPGNLSDVRVAALAALVDFVKVESDSPTLYWLLDMVEEDPEPYIRHQILRLLTENPPFTRDVKSALAVEALVERLWRLMNAEFSYDSRLRCDVADLYHTLYGKGRPACVPLPESVMVLNLREKTTTLNSALYNQDSQESSRGVKRRAQSPLDDSALNGDQNSNDSQVKLKIKESSRGVKRRAQSPLDDSALNGDQNSNDSQVKLKIKFGVEAGVGEVGGEGGPDPNASRGSRGPLSPSQFSHSLQSGYGTIPDAQARPPADIFAEANSPLIGGESSHVAAQDETSRMSRLSDSSGSNSRQPFTIAGGSTVVSGPTSFHSSMFDDDSRGGGGCGTPPTSTPTLGGITYPAPSSQPTATQPASLPASFSSGLFGAAAGLSQAPLFSQFSAPAHGESESRHHSGKKKKKKNKHKKHKHSKGTRDAYDSSLAYDTTSGAHSLLSPGTSLASTPYARRSSSPDFEVI